MWVSWTPTPHCVTPRGATQPSLNTPSSSDPHVKRSSAVETITRNKKEATLLYLKEKHVFPDLHFFFPLKIFICFLYRFFFQVWQLMILIGRALQINSQLWCWKLIKQDIQFFKTIHFFSFLFLNNIRKSQWRKVM